MRQLGTRPSVAGIFRRLRRLCVADLVDESDDLVVAALDRGATGTVADCERAGWPLMLLLPDVPVASSLAAHTQQ
jgi:hypothetical protein